MVALPSRKRRKVSPPDNSSSSTLKESPVEDSASVATSGFLANAAGWDLEQNYENRRRKAKRKEKENTRLPIKTAEGLLEQVEVQEDDNDNDSFLDSSIEGDETGNEQALEETPEKSTREQIDEAKKELARIGTLLNEDPEDHIGGLKRLGEIAKSSIGTIKRLALATQAAVFKDLIPGYRIRPLDEDVLAVKVSKDVRKLRSFEQTLVSSYQNYVKELTAWSRKSRRDVDSDVSRTATVAISCTCILILAVPHFNYRGELLKVLINKLSTRNVDPDFEKCRSTLEQLFREDEDGKPSHEAVGLLCRMVKARNYNVDESVLNTLLHLRLLSELAVRASQNSVDKVDNEPGRHRREKQRKAHMTKKQRKSAKELKAIEKEFHEADAIVSHEEREKLQAESLKLIFGLYIRILKARSPSLMGTVLEGLAKFAHLINQDYFGDLLVALEEIASKSISSSTKDSEAEDKSEYQRRADNAAITNPHRTALLCATTAFALLSSQDAKFLNLDLSYFTDLLYALLLPLSTTPDLELSSKSMRLAGPEDPNYIPPKVDATTLSTLAMRALQSSLVPRTTPPTRLAAFVHRLMIFALQVPEKTSLATVTLLGELSRTQGKKVRSLWSSEERRGDGNFDHLGGIEACRPFCGTVWEGELLRLHYADGVRDSLGTMERLVADIG